MTETTQIILGLCILIPVYLLTRRVHAWRMGRAYRFIIQDLERKGAMDPASAVVVAYAKRGVFRVGTRDYRPKVLEFMVAEQIVGKTEGGRYYLKETGAKSFNF